jgi:4-amino-4-deoxychorismate lyase
MNAWQWTGTAFEECDSVPLSDRGFRYGMSVFESIRVTDSRPQHMAAHIARLNEACATVGFQSDPVTFSAAGPLLESLGEDGFARIYVTAGDGTALDAVSETRVYLFLEPRDAPSPAAFTVHTANGVAHPMFGGLKTANYWSNLYFLQRAHAAGLNEALLFTSHGHLVSACCANVFVVFDGRMRTPPPSCGARRGVIRELVMQRVPVAECAISRNDLLAAEEVFLTNSWFGVMPVATLDGRALPSRKIAASLAGF